ncbi:hypothetical protein ACIRU3_45205 [Streptomyces sp. NPDC101151]|uniref:hypothetical protein n=1 Tax=Streptomyces sp. NPDC101151 TaxID=3366115 RepID=UPI00380356E3
MVGPTTGPTMGLTGAGGAHRVTPDGAPPTAALTPACHTATGAVRESAEDHPPPRGGGLRIGTPGWAQEDIAFQVP